MKTRLLAALQAHPVKVPIRIVVSLIRRQWPRFRRAVVAYDEGRSKIFADLGTALGLCLFRYGHTDPDIGLVRALLQPGDTFVDGGANIGLFTLAAAARVGAQGKVIAFEPGIWAFEALRRNVALNHFDWVEIHAIALADVSGHAQFTSFDGDSAGWSSFSPRDLPHHQYQSVPVMTLDEFLSPVKRGRLTLIKLDLEGAEYRTLLGCRGILVDPAPDFLIEMEPEHLARQGASVGDLFGLFAQEGYRMFSVESDKRTGQVALREICALPEGLSSPNIFVSKDYSRACKAGLTVIRLPESM